MGKIRQFGAKIADSARVLPSDRSGPTPRVRRLALRLLGYSYRSRWLPIVAMERGRSSALTGVKIYTPKDD